MGHIFPYLKIERDYYGFFSSIRMYLRGLAAFIWRLEIEEIHNLSQEISFFLLPDYGKKYLLTSRRICDIIYIVRERGD